MKYLISLLLISMIGVSAFAQTRGVSYDNATKNVIQNDLNQTFQSVNVTGNMQHNGVDIVDAGRTITAGAGLSGGGTLASDRTLTLNPASFVNSVTWWDGSQASRTWTFSLSGATDPTWTIGDGVMNLSAGTLQQGGVAVVLQSRTITIDGTANEITSSAGAQDLSGNRTWTLSLPTAITLTSKTLTGGSFTGQTFTGAPTLADNIKWTFNPGANNAGINVGSHAGDPNAPANGDIWYDSNANELTARINGSNVALGAGGGGSGNVSGPASSTDSALMLWDGAGGDTAKDSSITSDGTSITIPGSIIITGPTPGLLSIITEGTTADAFEGELTSVDPTADRTWTLPDRSGTVIVSADTHTDGQVLTWDNATGTWISSSPGAGSVTWDGIGDAAASSVIALGGFTNQITSTLDGATVFSIYNTDADNAADTVGLEIAFNDAADANSIFLRAVSDADGTPSTLFSVTGTAFTTSLPSTFSGGLSTTGGLTLRTANDPDVTTEGSVSWDANGDVLRVHDGTRQVAVGRVMEEIHVTVITPQDLADAQRDAFLFWSNESGMPFVVTGWKGWSGTDDTTLNIEEVDADGVGNNSTVDAVELATGSGPFTGADTTISGATIENGHLLILDFDDTDAPTYVKMTITGYYDADVN